MYLVNKYEFSYIYALIDPRDDRIRYIGASVNPDYRYREHLHPANLKPKNHKNHWIRNLLSNGLKPIMKILERVPFAEWREYENKWIVFYGRENLTNSTDGGEGNPGLIMEEETKQKISEANKGRKRSKRCCEDMSKRRMGNKYAQGTIRTPEVKEEASKRMMGNKYSLGYHPTEESKNKKLQTTRGRKNKNASSKYMGVHLVKSTGKYEAKIRVNKKSIGLGSYLTEEEAAKAYNDAEIKYYGDNAKLNII